jgi:predicted Na+-dependent transporter
MHTLSKLLVAILIASMTFEIGLSVPLREMREQLRDVRKLLRGLLLFLVVAPLTAALVAWAFRVDRPAEVALVLLACAGVVPLAPRFARSARGDVVLALELSFVLGLVTIVTCVPTARWLLGYSGEVQFGVGRLIAQLVFLQGAPLALGLLIRRASTRADSVVKVVGWVNTLAFVAVALLIVAPHLDVLMATGWRGAAATVTLGVVLAVAGYVIGGPGESGARTLAGIANGPNVSLALVIISSVGAPPAFGVSVVGVFLLRTLVGTLVTKFLARRAEHAHVAPDGGEPSRT